MAKKAISSVIVPQLLMLLIIDVCTARKFMLLIMQTK